MGVVVIVVIVVRTSAEGVVDSVIALGACSLPGMRTWRAGLGWVDILGWAGPVTAPTAPFAMVLAFLDRRPAHSIHNFHDHDRWSRGFVWVEAAGILTWAERGMPLNEHCRTPLWPNSDQGRIAPGLICLDVRRERYTIDRGERLRIAWEKEMAQEREILAHEARSASRTHSNTACFPIYICPFFARKPSLLQVGRPCSRP